MNWKRFLLAVVVGYVVLIALGYVIHQIWLKSDYQLNAVAFRLEEAMMQRMWIMWLGELLFVVMFAWIYTRGLEDRPWLGQGLRYGVAVTLLVVVPTSLSEYVVYPIPHLLALKWIGAGAVEVILLGLIVAGIYRESAD